MILGARPSRQSRHVDTSWGSTTTAGTLAWAIEQANASSATGNLISIAPNLLIDVDGATAINAALDLAQFTRSVTIQGNGATLVGNPTFVTSGGQTVTKNNPDAFVSGDTPVTPSFSFAKIGTFGQDNSAITVSIAGLNADGLNRFALIEPGARLDATINLSSSTIRDSNSGPAIILAGGTANVVSSVLDGSGGVMVTTDDADGLSGQIGYQTSAGGALTADAYSWVRPTPAQTAILLPSLFSQPSPITGERGLPVDVISVSPLIEETCPFPLASLPLANGVLIGVVPDADGANVLLNPIDGSVITLDVFGQARTTGGLRNAGAVESTVPEIDPAAFGGGLSLLLGALACLENRRRLRR